LASDGCGAPLSAAGSALKGPISSEGRIHGCNVLPERRINCGTTTNHGWPFKETNMATSEKQIAANRINALKSHGPTNTASTRTNATKHGLSAAGVTALDDAEGFLTMLSDLEKETNPVGTIEKFLVESAALEMVRLRRARRLEAQHIDGSLNPPYRTVVPTSSTYRPQIDPGLPASIKLEDVHPLVKLYQKYEATGLQRFFRFVHELERLIRMRHGEQLPAPAALDVSVHQETGMEAGIIPLPQEETLGDKEDTAIKRAPFPGPETEFLGDQEVKD
jgi:hypothetical protein